MQNDDEPKLKGAWPLVRLDGTGRPMWHVAGSNPPQYDYDLRLEALWRAGQARLYRPREIVQLSFLEAA